MAGADIAFEPFNALERLLLAAANKEPGALAAFQAGLLKHDLYAATPKPMPVGALGAGDQVDLITVDAGGMRGIALFTSLERLVDSFPQAGYVQSKGAALLGLVRDKGVVLNFNQPHVIAWTPDAIGRVLDAGKPRLV